MCSVFMWVESEGYVCGPILVLLLFISYVIKPRLGYIVYRLYSVAGSFPAAQLVQLLGDRLLCRIFERHVIIKYS